VKDIIPGHKHYIQSVLQIFPRFLWGEIKYHIDEHHEFRKPTAVSKQSKRSNQINHDVLFSNGKILACGITCTHWNC